MLLPLARGDEAAPGGGEGGMTRPTRVQGNGVQPVASWVEHASLQPAPARLFIRHHQNLQSVEKNLVAKQLVQVCVRQTGPQSMRTGSSKERLDRIERLQRKMLERHRIPTQRLHCWASSLAESKQGRARRGRQPGGDVLHRQAGSTTFNTLDALGFNIQQTTVRRQLLQWLRHASTAQKGNKMEGCIPTNHTDQFREQLKERSFYTLESFIVADARK